jgi:hypothetical protein
VVGTRAWPEPPELKQPELKQPELEPLELELEQPELEPLELEQPVAGAGWARRSRVVRRLAL